MKSIIKLGIGASTSVLAVLACLAALVGATAAPASAGGWVVVSLDDHPQFRPGEPADVGFTVLRHGVVAESSDDMQIVVTDVDGGQQRFAVVPEGDTGHHVATITLRASGTYTWALHGTFMPYEFGTIEVGDAPAASWGWDAAQWGGLGAVAVALTALAGGEVARRRRTVPAAA